MWGMWHSRVNVVELRGDVAYDGHVVAAFDEVGSGRVLEIQPKRGYIGPVTY